MTMNMYQRAVQEDNISDDGSSAGGPIAEICRQSSSSSSSQLPIIGKKSTQRCGGTTTKRSFDVAFLMAPDDHSKKREQKLQLKKQLQIMQQQPYHRTSTITQPNDQRTKEITVESNNNNFLTDRRRRNYNDDNHPLSLTTDDLLKESPSDYFTARSAFIKVESPIFPSLNNHPILVPLPVNLSPSSASSGGASYRSAVSPDVAYQDSSSSPSRNCYTPHNGSPPAQLIYESKTTIPSTSPIRALSSSPVLSRSPVMLPPPHHHHQTTTPLLPPQVALLHQTNPLSTQAAFQYLVSSNHKTVRYPIDISKKSAASRVEETISTFSASATEAKNNSIGFPFSATATATTAPDNLVLPYGGFAMTPFPFAAGPAATTAAGLNHHATVGLPVNPLPIFSSAAANLTAALLPSSLAALTLPAQNVCAKCNMNFRMTSDLVYHMRSHHKNEHSFSDSYKKRREQDKLKCPVCNESFRERHHLTRHMTAHQDKDGDGEEISRKLTTVESLSNGEQNLTTSK